MRKEKTQAGQLATALKECTGSTGRLDQLAGYLNYDPGQLRESIQALCELLDEVDPDKYSDHIQALRCLPEKDQDLIIDYTTFLDLKRNHPGELWNSIDWEDLER